MKNGSRILAASCLGISLMAMTFTVALNAAEGDQPPAPAPERLDRPPRPERPDQPPPEGLNERRQGGPEVRSIRRGGPELEERLRLMDAEIKELRRVGDNAEADRLERQRNQLKERGMGERQPRDAMPAIMPGEGGPRPGMEMERRQRLIRAAVENLQAAGFPELAERVAQESRELMNRPMNMRQFPSGAANEGMGRMGGNDSQRMEMMMREMQQTIRDLDRRLRALER